MQTVAEKQQIPTTVGILVETAIDEAEPGVALRTTALALFESDHPALRPVIREAALRALVFLLGRERARRSPRAQLFLPGIEAPLPLRVPKAEGGGRRTLLKATYEDLRRYRFKLQMKEREPSPRILQIKALMKLMRKYRIHGITVGEVLEREGIGPKL